MPISGALFCCSGHISLTEKLTVSLSRLISHETESATCLDSLFMPALPLLRRLVPTVAGARPVASLSQESSNTSAVQIAARLGTGGVHTAVDVQLRPGNNTGRRNPTNTDHGPSRE
jgi:hypothetical protein